MIRKYFVGMFLIFTILLAACTPAITPSPPPTETASEPTAAAAKPTAPEPTTADETEPVVDLLPQLLDVQWVLVGYGDPANPTVVEEDTMVTAEFGADGAVRGSGGCNQYSATYTLHGERLGFGPIATTAMTCEKGMEQEDDFHAALYGAYRGSFSNEGRLQIDYHKEDGSEGRLIFVRSQTPLVGTIWVLQFYGDPEDPSAVESGAEITAIFAEDGNLSGSAGCNDYSASYRTQDGQMQVEQPISTMMECQTGMEQEFTYLAALAAAESYRIVGPRLEIGYDGGAGVLKFTSLNLTLEHTLWALVSIDETSLPAEMNVTALFESGDQPNENLVGGSAGCNNYSASYTVEDDRLNIGVAASTMMICDEAVMQVESSYLAALETAQSYQIFANRLTIATQSGSLVYAANRAPLEGTLWKLASMGSLESPQSPVAGADFSAQFVRQPGFPSGLIVGATGCNDYNAVYAASLNEIKVNPPARTDNPACASGLPEQEQAYFAALNAARNYRILGDTLQMPYGEGQVLNFIAANPPVAEGPGPLSALDGTKWWLMSIDASAILPGSEVTAEFAIEADGTTGQISGSAGCNNYNAEIAGVFQVGPPASTRKACPEPPGVMEQEYTYLGALEQADSFTLSGNQLLIGTGSGILVYRNSLQPMLPIEPPAGETPEGPIYPSPEPPIEPYPQPPVEGPIAVISAPPEAVVAQAITFDGSASQSNIGIASYTWDFGDGATADGAVIEHAFAAPGSYTVTLIVVDTAGQVGKVSITVVIK